MWRLLLALLFFLPSGASAQMILGTAKVIDGDTIDLGGQRVRLHGIDAVEAQQSCSRNGELWNCGQDATALLSSLANGRPVTCRQRDIDRYDRIVATCEVGRQDLGKAMIDAGFAVALPQFSQAYLENEALAKQRRTGIWGSEFDPPATYRAAHPTQYRPPVQPKTTPQTFRQRPVVERNQSSGAYYRNCAAAWAAGVAPIYRGQPGYRPEMDGDGDGIACEPIRGRR
ncbi:thermonuclease family protein [Novosphingobium album (ex Hu et al. 2023)]|uniref:Thermonuclease family protein n=1 Tax=Novosphingobium album (ex Hu et al. 2023) TaxID=2930093 RepID=A0ABT0B7L2_9SPHN|nr:thermonuclease family protein [Novosphingobium album (ex Hu et al. 2023)]MCJ2181055.1 thermonuclease family protein [Novosphingobium album (ex Hu et al. 2023)]